MKREIHECPIKSEETLRDTEEAHKDTVNLQQIANRFY